MFLIFIFLRLRSNLFTVIIRLGNLTELGLFGNRKFSLTLLLTFLYLARYNLISFLHELFHRSIRCLTLETFDNICRVADRGFIWLGVKPRILITGLIVHGLFNHITLTFVEHLRSQGLVLLITRHKLFELFIGIM